MVRPRVVRGGCECEVCRLEGDPGPLQERDVDGAQDLEILGQLVDGIVEGALQHQDRVGRRAVFEAFCVMDVGQSEEVDARHDIVCAVELPVGPGPHPVHDLVESVGQEQAVVGDVARGQRPVVGNVLDVGRRESSIPEVGIVAEQLYDNIITGSVLLVGPGVDLVHLRWFAVVHDEGVAAARIVGEARRLFPSRLWAEPGGVDIGVPGHLPHVETVEQVRLLVDFRIGDQQGVLVLEVSDPGRVDDQQAGHLFADGR